ncbi:MAG: MFS transporter [Proteobacteria bacterium]|nr:MFS transporter [Pseudomonadota bacterium]
MHRPSLAAAIARRLPFYYGWVIVAAVCCAHISRVGPAVATLSIFVEPMTREFGWSRTELAGAVSLGGVLAALTSPFIGSFLDARGPRVVLTLAVITTGLTILGLSTISSLVAFYLLFCIARMNFAGPFDLGIYGAVANWFVVRRPLATSLATLSGMVGLMIMPLVAYFAIAHGGWREGWLAVGLTVLGVGLLPSWLLIARRPEDLGLEPDGVASPARGTVAPTPQVAEEQSFTRAEAMGTSTFWLLALYTLLLYPVQAGVSLHQAANLIEQGISPSVAAACVTVFSTASGASSLAFGVAARRLGMRFALALAAIGLVAGTLAFMQVRGTTGAVLAAIVFGIGIGGLQTGVPVVWADYFGRKSYGAIRGVALSVQVVAQASGPLISGILRDWTGNYRLSLLTFACLASLATLAALLVKPPRRPARLF